MSVGTMTDCLDGVTVGIGEECAGAAAMVVAPVSGRTITGASRRQSRRVNGSHSIAVRSGQSDMERRHAHEWLSLLPQRSRARTGAAGCGRSLAPGKFPGLFRADFHHQGDAQRRKRRFMKARAHARSLTAHPKWENASFSIPVCDRTAVSQGPPARGIT